MKTALAEAMKNTGRVKISCPRCDHVIFDGQAVLSRCVLIEDHGAKAKCKCKEWVRVPLRYTG